LYHVSGIIFSLLSWNNNYRMVGTEITMVMGALDDSKDDLQIRSNKRLTRTRTDDARNKLA
jgi:hypothetical protein